MEFDRPLVEQVAYAFRILNYHAYKHRLPFQLQERAIFANAIDIDRWQEGSQARHHIDLMEKAFVKLDQQVKRELDVTAINLLDLALDQGLKAVNTRYFRFDLLPCGHLYAWFNQPELVKGVNVILRHYTNSSELLT